MKKKTILVLFLLISFGLFFLNAGTLFSNRIPSSIPERAEKIMKEYQELNDDLITNLILFEFEIIHREALPISFNYSDEIINSFIAFIEHRKYLEEQLLSFITNYKMLLVAGNAEVEDLYSNLLTQVQDEIKSLRVHKTALEENIFLYRHKELLKEQEAFLKDAQEFSLLKQIHYKRNYHHFEEEMKGLETKKITKTISFIDAFQKQNHLLIEILGLKTRSLLP